MDEFDKKYHLARKTKLKFTSIGIPHEINEQLKLASKSLGIKTRQKIIILALKTFLENLAKPYKDG